MAEDNSLVLAQQPLLSHSGRSSDASSRHTHTHNGGRLGATAFEQWITRVLPTGSVLAYESLAPSFNNQGRCYTSNRWLTLGLVVILTVSCFFFAFTDSIVHKGKTYFGVARQSKLKLLGLSDEEEEELCKDAGFDAQLKNRRQRKMDFVHAAVTAVVFLAMAISDVGFQNCFFPRADIDTQQWLKNIPLAFSICSILVLYILPKTRNKLWLYDPVEEHSNGILSHKKLVTNNVRSISANLARLLPTVPVVLYQSVSPYVTNQGQCHTANWCTTMLLVAIFTLSCVYFVFTDSFVHEGKTYSGVAMWGRLKFLCLSDEDKALLKDANFISELEKRRLKKLDWFHAILSALVFLAIAFNDVGLQNCFFPQASADARQLLRNLPLGTPILASLIFTIFPTKRRTLGADDSQTFSNPAAINVQVSNGPASTATSIIRKVEENYLVSLPASLYASATGRMEFQHSGTVSLNLPGSAIISAIRSMFRPLEFQTSATTSLSLEDDVEEALVLRPSKNLESGQVSTVTSATNTAVGTQEAQPSGSTDGNQQSTRRG